MATPQPEQLKEVLHKSLGKLEAFQECALLDYPDYPNIGDHLIGLGTVLYLINVQKTKIKYTASPNNFSSKVMEERIGKSPILLQGGGNLGDLWTAHQKFREQIISKYRDRPIIILPQSIYFVETTNLMEAANVFNSHPNLTLFVRDDYSYELALKSFYNCQVIKAPDMAFQMVNLPGFLSRDNRSNSILYHYRNDKELNQSNSQTSIDFPNLVVEDWTSFKYDTAERMERIREGLQKGTVIPGEWIYRHLWKYFHHYSFGFNNLYNSSMHLKSLSYMHHGMYQFKQHRLIITNRLHGHILCILMGIPHVFLPNAYHKNEAFYQAWTYSITFCRFVKEPSQIQAAAQELLELFPN